MDTLQIPKQLNVSRIPWLFDANWWIMGALVQTLTTQFSPSGKNPLGDKNLISGALRNAFSPKDAYEALRETISLMVSSAKH